MLVLLLLLLCRVPCQCRTQLLDSVAYALLQKTAQLVRLFRQLQLTTLFRQLEVRSRLRAVLATEALSSGGTAGSGDVGCSGATGGTTGTEAGNKSTLATLEAQVMARYSSGRSRVGQRLSGAQS